MSAALELVRLARKCGVKHGVVQDKLFLPGLLKLAMLVKSGFFGRILSVRGEFGYWVFEGDLQPIQRPSWNYRAADGGGIILDMMCHWRYVLDNLFGAVKSVSCLGATHIPQRWDEQGRPYAANADDACYATLQLEGDIVAQINSSWCTRVRRDDLVTFHVDGTHGSAVAGLMDCRSQARVNTPKPVWNPDLRSPMNFFEHWQDVPDTRLAENGFKVQWERFIRHVVADAPFQWDLLEGAKGVQLVECATAELARAPLDRRAGARDPHDTHDFAALSARTERRSCGRTHCWHGLRPLREPNARFNRVVYSAAHVVADPLATRDPWAGLRPGLGRDHCLSRASLESRPGCRRSDGHGAARHGARLAHLAHSSSRNRSARRAASKARCSPAVAARITCRRTPRARSTM